MEKKRLWIIIIIGLLVRFGLLFVDFSWDIHNHITWAKDMWGRGLVGFYTTPSSEVYATVYPNYPPLSLLFFYLIYPLQAVIFKLVWFLNTSLPLFPSKLVFFVESRAFLAGLFKLPAVLHDAGLAYVCFLFGKKITGGKKNLWPLIGAGLVMFNPAFFFNSALWGQIDSIPLFFALSAFYVLIYKKMPLESALLFVLGLLVKPTILLFLPVYGILLWRNFALRQIMPAILAAVVFFVLSFVSFLSPGQSVLSAFFIYSNKILATQSLPFTTNGAFNFWVLTNYFEGVKDTVLFFFGLSYRVWGYGIFIIILLFIIYLLLKAKKVNLYLASNAFMLSGLAGFLFLTKMHERYSLIFLPFLIVAAIQDKKLLKWVGLLSFLSLINHYHSWPVPKIEVVVGLLDNLFVVIGLCLINLVVFFALLNRYRNFSSFSKS